MREKEQFAIEERFYEFTNPCKNTTFYEEKIKSKRRKNTSFTLKKKMRPIKFRAFAKAKKKIYTVSKIDFEFQSLFLLGKNGNFGGFLFSEVELMQFTGLYDKHGKEIYEGDILRYCEKNKQIYIVKYGSYNRNADLKSTAPQYIGATFFLDGTGIGMYKKEDYEVINPIYTYNGHAFLYPVSGDFPSTFERYKELWGLEIIGNIYENTELLKQ